MYSEELRKLAEGFKTLPLVMDRDYSDPAELEHKIIALGGQKIGDVKKLEDGILFLCGMQIETTACIAFAVGGS